MPLDYDVHFGRVTPRRSRPGVGLPEPEDIDRDDDDELVDRTPDDVVEMLGFDPKELDVEDGHWVNQPRVPAGTPEGGEWTVEGALSAIERALGKAAEREKTSKEPGTTTTKPGEQTSTETESALEEIMRKLGDPENIRQTEEARKERIKKQKEEEHAARLEEARQYIKRWKQKRRDAAEGAKNGRVPEFSVKGQGHKNHAAVAAAIKDIPDDHLKLLGIEGLDVGVVDEIPASGTSGVPPFGVYVMKGLKGNIRPEVIVADRSGSIDNWRPDHTLVHEIGHAVDFATGNKLQETLAPIFEREFKANLTAEQQAYAKYYISNTAEMVAEAYTLVFGKAKHSVFGAKEAAKKKFPETVKFLESLDVWSLYVD